MIKIWGRNTSSNVQKAMWAVGELKLEHTRIDVGGAFGKTKEPAYLAMNPNALVPTLEEEDGFTLWESNSIIRYLAGKHDKAGVLEPKDAKQRALASQWMDWQLSVLGPAITPAFWGLIRTPPEKRDAAAIKTSQEKTVDRDADARTRSSAKRHSSPGLRSPTATFRSASCATATGNWYRIARRRPISTAGTTRSPSAKRSRITSAAFRCS